MVLVVVVVVVVVVVCCLVAVAVTVHIIYPLVPNALSAIDFPPLTKTTKLQ